jgi:hypothetical protein
VKDAAARSQRNRADTVGRAGAARVPPRVRTGPSSGRRMLRRSRRRLPRHGDPGRSDQPAIPPRRVAGERRTRRRTSRTPASWLGDRHARWVVDHGRARPARGTGHRLRARDRRDRDPSSSTDRGPRSSSAHTRARPPRPCRTRGSHRRIGAGGTCRTAADTADHDDQRPLSHPATSNSTASKASTGPRRLDVDVLATERATSLRWSE